MNKVYENFIQNMSVCLSLEFQIVNPSAHHSSLN